MSGCAALQPGPARGIDLSGDYDGFLDVEGELMPVSLQLLHSGASVSGRLASDHGLVARGRGIVSRREVHIELQYEMECPGVIVLDGDVVNDGLRLIGEFEAEDCTGSSRGAFDLRR